MKLTTYLQHAGPPCPKAVHYFTRLTDHLRKRQHSFGVLVFALFLMPMVGQAQVDVTATAGDMGPTSYTTLKGAFDAINAGTHQGVITISISGNTTETASCVLNASGAGSAVYTSVTISPTGGAARTISGAITAGSPLIDLNGADNVLIDGLNTGGDSLTIANTTVSATSGTSTVRFIGGATNNTITNCNVQGSGTMSVTTNGAVIFFSTDAVTGGGNDDNTISNCNIGPAGSNLPTKGILGNGSTGTAAVGNSGILINNNNIFDYFGAAVTSAGIAINGGCNTWSITNNRFYQTATRTWTTGAEHNAIILNSSTATSGVQGMTVTGNTIGYASNTQTGTYTLTGSTGIFRGIRFNGITSGTVSDINNNTIASVSLTGVTSSGSGTSSPFSAMIINNGVVNTNSNTIGSQSATGSLTFSTTTTSATDVYGIYNFSLNNWTSNSNTIGGISAINSGASGTFLVFALRANTSTSVSWTATSNTIGGMVANSIQLTATGASSQVIGMQTSNAQGLFTSNVIRNMTTNIGTGTTTGASMIGININTTTPNHTVSQNTIHTLTNTNTTAATIVTGIQFTGGSANIVERNLIYGLTSATTSTSAEVNGIRIAGGTTIYRNNMIALGAGIVNAIGGAPTNSSVAGIVGINEALGTNSVWHNSIYIGGTATAGSGSSYAFNGVQTTNTRSFRDNIFFNARTNSGATGKHYAIKINGTAPNPTGLTINNNIYFANGTGGVFGFFNSADVADLAAWKVAVGQDAASFQGNPEYNDPTNATPDLHLHPTNPTPAEAAGADVGVIDDYDGQTRASLTPVDIGADAGDFTPLPICMGTPPAGMISGASFVCAGLGTTLSFSNGSSDLGFTYQWASSLVSGGPYTDLLGTATTQATGAISATTYYQVTTTCTNSGLTNVSPEFAVTVNPIPTASAGSNSPVCLGDNLNLSVMTDIGTSFSWTGPNSFSSTDQNPTIMGVTAAAAGTYNVTVTAAGCSSTSSTVVVVNQFPVISSVTATPNPICSGGNSQLLAAAYVPTAANQLSFSSGTGSLADMTGATTAIGSGSDDTPSGLLSIGFSFPFNGTTHTQFSVSPDGFIKLGSPAAVAQFSNSVTSTTNIPKIYPYWDDMATGTTGNVTYLVTGTAPNRILVVQWFVTIPRNTSGAANSTFQAWLFEATGNIEFRYGTMGSGTMSASVGVTADATNFQSVTISSNTVSTTTANNANAGQPASGTSYVFAAPTVAYLWTPNTFLSADNIANPMASAVTTSTNYTVTVSGPSGCSTSDNLMLSITAPITAATISGNLFFCTGGTTTLTAVPTDGAAPYTYLWSPGGETTASIIVSTPGMYSCQVMDDCGGSVNTGSVTVVENPIPTASASSNSPVCAGADLNLSVTTDIGTSFTWAGPNSFSSTDQNPTIMGVTTAAAGTYTVTVTASGCSATSSTVVVVNPLPVISSVTATPATICAGGNSSLQVTLPSSPYCAASQTLGTCASDEWINNVAFGTISNGGQTCALGAPDNGYQDFTSLSTSLTAGSTGNVLTANISTFFSGDQMRVWIDWNQNGVFTDPGEEYLPTGAVAATTTFNIDVPAGALNGSTRMRVRLTFTGAIPPCGATSYGETEDYTVNVTGGADITYAWLPVTYLDDATIANPTASGVMATTNYTVTVTNSITGCSNTGGVTVTANPLPTATVSGGGTVCSGDPLPDVTFTLTGTGPWDLFYNDGMSDVPVLGITTSPYVIMNAPAGTYTVVLVSDANCAGTGSGSATVTVNPLVSAGTISGTTPLCVGDTPLFTTNGTAGGTWSSNNTSVASVNAMTGLVTAEAQGMATITYTVSTGCGAPVSADYIVTVNALDWGNLQWPPSATICEGSTFDAFGQVYEPGLTEAAGPGTGIIAEFGISPEGQNTNPSTWTNWITAPFNVQVGNNDEYWVTTGNSLAPGTYYYAFRYAYPGCSGAWQYGGYSMGGGGFWDGTTYISGVLTVDDAIAYYADADGDTYGDPNVTLQACTAPMGYVANNTDCDDTNMAVNPGATEVCNGIDDDCDGMTDEGVLTTFYADTDGDTYGDPNVSVQACSAPMGYVANNTDCDDTNMAVNPGATELCNGIDDDCDGMTDEGVSTTYYADADGDGYGNPNASIQACTLPMGYVTNSLDCNDMNPAIPALFEVCNGVDDNCDGNIDEGLTSTFYQDSDGDGFGNPAVFVNACTTPPGYVLNNLDCNDSSPTAYPGAPELCSNSMDDDCDGTVDEALIIWTGLGDGINWTNGANWNNGGAVPQTCNDIYIPAGANVEVPAGANVVGRTLQVELTAVLTVALTAVMTILP